MSANQFKWSSIGILTAGASGAMLIGAPLWVVAVPVLLAAFVTLTVANA